MLEAVVKKESWYLLRRPDRSGHVEGIQRERERETGKSEPEGVSQNLTNQWVLALAISCLMMQ